MIDSETGPEPFVFDRFSPIFRHFTFSAVAWNFNEIFKMVWITKQDGEESVSTVGAVSRNRWQPFLR